MAEQETMRDRCRRLSREVELEVFRSCTLPSIPATFAPLKWFGVVRVLGTLLRQLLPRQERRRKYL